jgi:DNA-binding LacI/PurR family transcriptional regulator
MSLPCTITDLAAYLNLSTAAVSRALNGYPDISQETRKRVIEAAAKLGYVPNHAARSLRRGKAQAIGFVINPAKVGDRPAAAQYFDIIRGIQLELSRHKLDLIILTASGNEKISEYIRRIAARRTVDGFILAETRPYDERIAFLEKAGIPFVAFGRSETPGQYSWLDIDFPAMAANSVERLHALGHRKIAISLGSAELFYIRKFMDFFRKRISELGLPYREDYVFRTRGDTGDGANIAGKIAAMPDPPTAIVNLYGTTAPGLYRGLKETGLLPGRDLAILTHVNEAVIGPLFPKLSGYTFDAVDAGRNLAQLLVASMPGDSGTTSLETQNKPHSILLPMSYVRGDTDVHPALAMA